jgi:hypothetical protein
MPFVLGTGVLSGCANIVCIDCYVKNLRCLLSLAECRLSAPVSAVGSPNVPRVISLRHW